MDALAILVHVGRKLGEIAPTLDLGAIVERHHDELRRALDLGAGGNGDSHEQRRNCPPDECCPAQHQRFLLTPPEATVESVLKW